jgi:hypothetical protein
MKPIGMSGLGLCLLAAVCGFLGAGCRNQMPPKNKGGTNGITLTGYGGGVPETPGGLEPEIRQRTLEGLGDNQGFLEIKEKMFIAQTNDVYSNPEEYLGKTLKLEGVFQTQKAYTVNGDPYYFVIRYGPGCCGSDGNAGFEVMWETPDGVYAQPNDWVEAVGVLKSYEEDGYPYICISLSSLKVLETRGAEFVAQ